MLKTLSLARASLVTVGFAVAFALCGLAFSIPAHAATLTTDKADYAPGETATIYGSLFDALQDVVLSIVGQAPDGTTATSATWNAQADENGSFTTQYALPDFYVPLYLLAANSTDGTVLAETAFTDSKPNTVSVTGQAPSPLTAGGSASFTVTVNFNGNGSSCTANLSISGLPAGASLGSFTPSSLVSTGGNVNSTLVINTTGAVTGGSHGFTVTATPSGCQSGASAQSGAGTLVVASVVKTDPTLSITNSPVAYDGASHAATVSASVAGVVSNVKYNGSATVPTDAGTYAVTADFAPTDTVNYNSLTGASAGSFLINQASSATAVTCPASVVYNGSAQTPCTVSVTGAGGLNLAPAADYSANQSVGTATAGYTFTGDTNHTGSSDSKTFLITKADATCSIGGYTGVYDGNAHGATGSCAGVGTDTNPSGLIFGAGVTDVPGGSAHWSFSNSNYNDQSGDVAVVLTQAASQTTVSCPSSVTYNGTAQTPCSVSVTGAGNLNLSPDADYADNLNVGTATASYVFAGDTNHTGSSDSKTFAIEKVDPVCTVTGYTVTYDGLAHTTTGSCLGVLGETLAGLDLSATTHTNAGNYSDPWTFTDVTGNYNDVASTVSDVINKADQSISFGNPGDQIFGATFSLVASASSGLGVSFASNNANCTVTGSTVHVVGLVSSSCSITASQAGNGNYNAAPDATQVFSVLPYGTNTKLPPMNLAKKDFQKMSTIPVKFSIYNGSTPISWAHAKLTINGTPAVSSGNANDGNNFRYDASGKLYIFNLSTKMSLFTKGNTYTFTITLDDGEVITQDIVIK